MSEPPSSPGGPKPFGALTRVLARRPHLRAALANANWLIAARLFELALAFLIGALVARYLGPQRYGALSYVLALYGLFEACSGLGLQQIGMREVVSGEFAPGKVLGTALALRAAAAVVAMLAFVGTLAVLESADSTLLGFGAILAVGHVLAAPDALALWFQAMVKSKYAVLARSGSRLLFVGLKLVLIGLGATLTAFVVAVAGELVLSGLLLLALFVRHADSSARKLGIDGRVMGRLLAEGWPLSLSALTMVLYARIDQVMLGDMLGQQEVGLYTAAVRISEGLYPLASMVMASVLPALIEARSVDIAMYRVRLQMIYDALIGGGLLAALLIWAVSGPLVVLLFGEPFVEAAAVLAVHVWSIVLLFPGTATHRYLMVEGLTRVSLWMGLSGAVVNLLLNLWLIPRHGVLGAAWATLASHFVASLVVPALLPGSRATAGFVLGALRPWQVVRRWRRVLGAPPR